MTFQNELDVNKALEIRTIKLEKGKTLTLQKFQVKSKRKINLQKLLKKAGIKLNQQGRNNQQFNVNKFKRPKSTTSFSKLQQHMEYPRFSANWQSSSVYNEASEKGTNPTYPF